MATYIELVNWTDQGARTAKDTIKRANAFKEVAAGMGVKVLSVQWTLGPYDIVITVDAPDDETVTRMGLMLALQGNVRSTTMRAFGEEEMGRIIGGIK
ncbi:GYD domain-containing protein [Paraburkholderia sp. GAS334]|uniref:GYD domain-containing protein n=1 Tax=unclassified Paraburkholderia TaxID=2615204 RepID=UPI003D1C9D8C